MVVLASAENVAYITGGATVISALILGVLAAVTADRRLKKQLDAEAVRQKATLDNDRKLVDLQHLRRGLDEAVTAAEEVFAAQVSLSVRLKGGSPRAEASDEDRPLVERATNAETALEAERRRIDMRFPPEGAVATAYGNIYDHVSHRMDHAFEVLHGPMPMSDEQANADVDLGVKTRDALKAFTDAARHEIGVREAEAESPP